MKTEFYGWKLLLAMWCILFINLAFPFYGASVINTYMALDFNLDRRVLGLIFTVFTLTSGLNSPVAAFVINKIGVRYTMLIGCVLILLSALAMATFVNSGMLAVVMFGIVAGTGVVSGGALSAQVIVANWFIRRRALALSLVLSAPGIGGFIAAPLLNSIISSAGGNWRLGWWLIAGLCCLAILVTALFIKNDPASIGQFPDGVAPDVRREQGQEQGSQSRFRVYRTNEVWKFSEAIRQPSLWLVMFCVIGYGSTFTLFQAHGVIHLQGLGLTPEVAAGSVSIMSISTLIGNFIIGALGDRVEPRYLWVMTICCSGLAMLLGPEAGNGLAIYPYVVLLG
ncbi:MAG: putative rane protein, partial [Gammaproteobacteria bacterium]|nr:putative rane protein [Gammaproteobacteria bacterium]